MDNNKIKDNIYQNLIIKVNKDKIKINFKINHYNLIMKIYNNNNIILALLNNLNHNNLVSNNNKM